MARFKATMSPESDRLVVSLVGECDLSVRDEMTTALLAAVERSPVVVVDLAGVDFLDSSGLHGLVSGYNAAQEGNRLFYVVNARGVVAQLLELTGIGELLSAPVDTGQPAGEAPHA
jgi:anti-sigma B factor antagonist